MAGYSYLTIGNLRAFLLHPFTIPFVIFILLLGMIFLLIETGAMVTAYHSSIYLRKISAVSIFLEDFPRQRMNFAEKTGNFC